jgi:hypothetical protein
MKFTHISVTMTIYAGTTNVHLTSKWVRIKNIQENGWDFWKQR